jgi:XTP/dITP diphosphohydrolase
MLKNYPVTFMSLADWPDAPDVVEDGKTFLENALKKARTISEFTGEIVLADDSGLVVDFLDGRPGVYSSRYAGIAATDEENIKKLLKELGNVPREKRGASFVCVLVLYFPDGQYESFEGRWRGFIYEKTEGCGGFGYDPVFYLPDREITVAQMSADEKNGISHRARAFEKLTQYLQQKMQFLDAAVVRGDII